jgi:hypothetical protein
MALSAFADRSGPPQEEELAVVLGESFGVGNALKTRLVSTAAAGGSLTTEFFAAASGGNLLSHIKGTLERKA